MGTSYSIIFENQSVNVLDLNNQIDSVLNCIEELFSTYRGESEISKINNSNLETIPITNGFYKLLFIADSIYSITQGAFDPTIMPIMEYWGFADKSTPHRIDSFKVDSLLEYVGWHKLAYSDTSLIKKKDGIQLDFSAFAKGYGVDKVCSHLERLSINNYMVEIGGEVRAQGLNSKGNLWQIGVDQPFIDNDINNRTLACIVKLENKSMATSGNYRNIRKVGNKIFGHTINPITGYPHQSEILSVGVITNNCVIADAYATAFMVLGYDKSLKIVETSDHLEAIFIKGMNDNTLSRIDFTIHATEGIKDKMIVFGGND